MSENLSVFTIILLISVLIALFADIAILFRISKKGNKNNDIDSRYYELKYNINLIRSIAAIVLFLLAFFGFRTIGDIEERLKNEMSDSLIVQDAYILDIQNQLMDYSSTIEELEELKQSLSTQLKKSETRLNTLNNKLISLNDAYKLYSKIYITEQYFSRGKKDNSREPEKFYFRDMKTVFGEPFPNFVETPFVTIQGYKQSYTILEVTNEYVLVTEGASNYTDDDIPDNYDFHMWVASPE